MSTFEAVGIMVGLEDGLTKEQVEGLLSKLPVDKEFLQFDVSNNNSTIWGFVTTEFAEDRNHYPSIVATCMDLCEDFNNERPDKIYTTESGLEIFIDCDAETILIDDQVDVFQETEAQVEESGDVLAIQSYRVKFDMGNPVAVEVNVYHEHKTQLTDEEILEEAIGYAEEVGIIFTESDHHEIIVLQKG